MNDIERSVSVIVEHMGLHQKTSLQRFARGEKITKQALLSLESRGMVRRQNDSHLITPDGVVALHLIKKETIHEEEN